MYTLALRFTDNDMQRNKFRKLQGSESCGKKLSVLVISGKMN